MKTITFNCAEGTRRYNMHTNTTDRDCRSLSYVHLLIADSIRPVIFQECFLLDYTSTLLMT